MVTHIKSILSILLLACGRVHPHQHAVGVPPLYVVKLSHDERQEVRGHDGGAGKADSL